MVGACSVGIELDVMLEGDRLLGVVDAGTLIPDVAPGTSNDTDEPDLFRLPRLPWGLVEAFLT